MPVSCAVPIELREDRQKIRCKSADSGEEKGDMRKGLKESGDSLEALCKTELSDDWKVFADDRGNYGILTEGHEPCFVVLFDDDAHHCTGGHGWCWKMYMNGWNKPVSSLFIDRTYDEYATGFSTATEAVEDLIDSGFML